MIRGNEGCPGNPGIAMMGSQIAPALHITEDTSRRSREHRAELLRFMKEVRKVIVDIKYIEENKILLDIIHTKKFYQLYFLHQNKKRHPEKHCVIRTDRLYVDHDYVYAWSERNQRIER